ncbi:efflux RND transporter periplasmic adaptor subunit [Aurantiacibacter flavus]|uniref:Efflux RND transporter periplasmic adaptor subunit n=1 Tax=Aurantiacibacter flavus TaxID=3145232 RepID=A0ABV0D109_9SPHN
MTEATISTLGGSSSHSRNLTEWTQKHGRKILAALGVALVLALAIYLLFLRPGTTPTAAGEASTALTVTTATPQRTTWSDSVTGRGVVAPWQEASISAQIGSYQLVDVRVNVGAYVRRGQVLARLNPAILRAEVSELEARQAQAVAEDRRARGLQEVGGISDQEALRYATEAKTVAALLAAKRLELQYTTIRAPDDGLISAREATLGAVVSPGQELFRLIRRNRLEWRGEIAARDFLAVRQGQTVTLTLPDGGSAEARIRDLAPSLDPETRLGIVYADILPGSAARAGMYVEGDIAMGESAALTVPAESVVTRDGRNYVMLLSRASGTSKVTLRGVTTGRRESREVEITDGLAGNAILVRRGAAFLDDGDIVTIAGTGTRRP